MKVSVAEIATFQPPNDTVIKYGNYKNSIANFLQRNVHQLKQGVEKAAKKKARLVVFAEFGLTNYKDHWDRDTWKKFFVELPNNGHDDVDGTWNPSEAPKKYSNNKIIIMKIYNFKNLINLFLIVSNVLGFEGMGSCSTGLF